MRDVGRLGLLGLPVELLAEIYLLALEPSLPIICRHTYSATKSFPPSVHAQYLLGRHPYINDLPRFVESGHFSAIQFARILRYPICTLPVFQSMCRIILLLRRGGMLDKPSSYSNVTFTIFELPRRWFRRLDDDGGKLGPDSDPLPFLRFLWESRSDAALRELQIPALNADSCGGYPLVRAVHARFTPLIQFLLDRGADPGRQKCLAVKVAIGKRDLALVKMLVEYPPERGAKRRKRSNRVPIQPELLNFAVKVDAREIVQYLMEEKGCAPDMETLELLQIRTNGGQIVKVAFAGT